MLSKGNLLMRSRIEVDLPVLEMRNYSQTQLLPLTFEVYTLCGVD